MVFKIAKKSDIDAIMQLYKDVVAHVKTTDIKLGWNTEIYPDNSFIDNAINASECYVIFDDNKLIACAVINNNVNTEYDLIDWTIKAPKEKIATIHALCVSPEYRGRGVSSIFLKNLMDKLQKNGNISIHLDVIDTNIPAYKLYENNGYTMVKEIEMYYEVVGTRHFSMFEYNF